PHADHRPLLRQFRHARRRRRLWHPRHAGGQGRDRGQEGQPPQARATFMTAQELRCSTPAHPSRAAAVGPPRVAGLPALLAMLEARSVALVGASTRPGTLGARMVAEVARSPASPAMYLVNPKYREIGGVPCHPSLAALPGPVDLVLLGVPDAALAAQVDLAARRGDKS